MPLSFVDGAPIEPGLLGTNDGFNYGRFDVPGLEVHAYEVRLALDEVLTAITTTFDALVAEMRTDDLLDDEPSALARMGYPSLRDAFEHPSELREVIRIYLDPDLLCAFAPYTERSAYIINSTDEIHVAASGITFRGRCFRRPWP